MQTLHKSLSFWGGLGLAFSLVVGTGLLGLPGITVEEFGLENATFSWFTTVLAMIPLIAIFVRLGFRYQSAGGIAYYADKAIGPWGSYAVSFLVYGCIVIGMPAGCTIAGAYLQRFLGLPDHLQHESGIIVLWTVTLINLAGVRLGSIVNLCSMVVLTALLVVLMGLNIPFIVEGAKFVGQTVETGVHLRFDRIWQGSLVIFWAFIGWEELSFGLEEFHNPEKNVPRVYWVSFILISILYILLALMTAGASVSGLDVRGPGGLTEITNLSSVGHLLVFAMVLVLLSNQSANFFAFSRLLFAAGRDGKLPRYLGRTNPKGIPAASILTSSAIYTSVLVFTDYFNISLTDIVTLVDRNYLMTYLFALVAFWKVDRSPWRYPLSLAGLCSGIFFFSGIDWTLAYPLILMGVGYLQYRFRKSLV